MAEQERQIKDKVNAETSLVVTGLSNALSDALLKQIRLLAPDAVEIAKRREMEANVAQIRRDLDRIKIQIGTTNPPTAGP